MAHVSGGIMAAYIAKGVEAKHLLGAVIMTAPGTLLIAKTLVPETEIPASGSSVEMAEVDEAKGGNLLGAISRGTGDGLNLAINVAAMLIAFLALIALANGIMGWVHGYIGWFPASLESVLGWLFAPVAWLIGIPWKDATHIGSLLGIRMVGNELIAYGQLGAIEGAIGSAFIHHRHIRVVRFCQSEFHRHSDRRHRRAGALAQGRSGQTGFPRDAGGHDGQPDFRRDCRDDDVEDAPASLIASVRSRALVCLRRPICRRPTGGRA